MRHQSIKYIITSITLIIVTSISLLSCHSSENKTFITNKPLAIDSSYFEFIRNKFKYEQFDRPDSILGGLNPRLPLLQVYSSDFKNNTIWYSEGMITLSYGLVVQDKGSLILIDTKDKFKEFFAPIENEQEALSYTAYLTRTYPEYDIHINPNYRIYSKSFPSTYAKRINGGFEVLLHDKEVFGCGPHSYVYKIFTVSNSGTINLIRSVKMFENPQEDGLCID